MTRGRRANSVATVRSALVPGLMPARLQVGVPAQRAPSDSAARRACAARAIAAPLPRAPPRHAGAVFARDMAVGQARRERSGRPPLATCRRRRSAPAARSAGRPMSKTSSKPVTYWRAMRSRPAALAHRRAQRRRAAARCTSWLGDVPESAGLGQAIAREGVVGVVLRRARPAPPARPRAQVAPVALGRRRERRAEQHDAEIGVGCRPPRGVASTAPRMRAPTRARARQRRGRGPQRWRGRAPPSCRWPRRRHGHCRASAPSISARQARHVGVARCGAATAIAAQRWPAHRRAGRGARRRHAAPRRRPRSPASQRVGDVDVDAPICRPDQAGMQLTSSTSGRPSRADDQVDAGKVAPTASGGDASSARPPAASRASGAGAAPL